MDNPALQQLKKSMEINMEDMPKWAQIMIDQNAQTHLLLERIVELLEKQPEQKNPDRGKPPTPRIDVDRIIPQVKDGKNYTVAECKELFGLSSVYRMDEFFKNVPGKWQNVGDMKFITGTDLKIAMKGPRFFRPQ